MLTCRGLDGTRTRTRNTVKAQNAAEPKRLHQPCKISMPPRQRRAPRGCVFVDAPTEVENRLLGGEFSDADSTKASVGPFFRCDTVNLVHPTWFSKTEISLFSQRSWCELGFPKRNMRGAPRAGAAFDAICGYLALVESASENSPPNMEQLARGPRGRHCSLTERVVTANAHLRWGVLAAGPTRRGFDSRRVCCRSDLFVFTLSPYA